MIRVRKNRLGLRPGTYCGHTTPTVRMSVIVSSRTRASHSSQAFVAKLWSMIYLRPKRAIMASPNTGRKTDAGESLPHLSSGYRPVAGAGIVVVELHVEQQER